jgi:hypothetical protein
MFVRFALRGRWSVRPGVVAVASCDVGKTARLGLRHDVTPSVALAAVVAPVGARPYGALAASWHGAHDTVRVCAAAGRGKRAWDGEVAASWEHRFAHLRTGLAVHASPLTGAWHARLGITLHPGSDEGSKGKRDEREGDASDAARRS